MKCIKFILLFVIVSLVSVSCSTSGGHTRCAAYTINEPSDSWGGADVMESREYKDSELIY